MIPICGSRCRAVSYSFMWQPTIPSGRPIENASTTVMSWAPGTFWQRRGGRALNALSTPVLWRRSASAPLQPQWMRLTRVRWKNSWATTNNLKFLAEQEAQQAALTGQEVVIVNPSTPIGAWDIKPTPTGEIILRFLRRQMPAYLNTGLNFIDVRDVAAGHLLAAEHGKSGDRYILGHQNLTLKTLLDQLATLTGLPAPQQTVPYWLPLSVAWVDEQILARLGKTPTVPVDGVRMARQFMYYDASKAVQQLGLPQTPIQQSLEMAVDWFVEQGYVNFAAGSNPR